MIDSTQIVYLFSNKRIFCNRRHVKVFQEKGVKNGEIQTNTETLVGTLVIILLHFNHY